MKEERGERERAIDIGQEREGEIKGDRRRGLNTK